MYDRAGNSYENRSAAPSNVHREGRTRSGASGRLRSVRFPERLAASARRGDRAEAVDRDRRAMGRVAGVDDLEHERRAGLVARRRQVEVAAGAGDLGRDAQRPMDRGGHLLGVVRRHAPDLAAREEELALVPAVVVLLPRLEAVRRAVDQDEVAVPLRGVEDAGVAERPRQVVPAAVLLEDARLQRRPRRPLLHELPHPGERGVDLRPLARVVAADVDVPQRGLAVQLLHDPLRDRVIRLPPGAR